MWTLSRAPRDAFLLHAKIRNIQEENDLFSSNGIFGEGLYVRGVGREANLQKYVCAQNEYGPELPMARLSCCTHCQLPG